MDAEKGFVDLELEGMSVEDLRRVIIEQAKAARDLIVKHTEEIEALKKAVPVVVKRVTVRDKVSSAVMTLIKKGKMETTGPTIVDYKDVVDLCASIGYTNRSEIWTILDQQAKDFPNLTGRSDVKFWIPSRKDCGL